MIAAVALAVLFLLIFVVQMQDRSDRERWVTRSAQIALTGYPTNPGEKMHWERVCEDVARVDEHVRRMEREGREALGAKRQTPGGYVYMQPGFVYKKYDRHGRVVGDLGVVQPDGTVLWNDPVKKWRA